MIVLDTNVLSALMRDAPDPKVVSWMDRQAATSIWTTSITVFEIETGLQLMPSGRRRTALSEQYEMLLDQMDRRLVFFDGPAARLAANLSAFRQKKGRVIEMRDTMIAGIVLAHHATLATRNVTHFADISASVVNPWTA